MNKSWLFSYSYNVLKKYVFLLLYLSLLLIPRQKIRINVEDRLKSDYPNGKIF